MGMKEVLDQGHKLKAPAELTSDLTKLRFSREAALSTENQSKLYDYLVCHDELSAPLDRHGRTIRDQQKSYASPAIDEILGQTLGEPSSPWPDNCHAAVCLTHDVDRGPGLLNCLARDAFYGLKWVGAKVRNNRQKLTPISRYFSLRKSRIDPYDNLVRWMELENDLGVRSTFYFMALSAHHLLQEGNRYVVSNPAIRHAIQQMHKNNWEVGLHARYHAPFSKRELIDQKHRLEDILESAVMGVRNHYLRVRFPETWLLEAECNFDYGSNMGWADTLGGFRSGTCWPYQPVSGSKLWEIPFQMMDSFDLSKDAEAFLERFKRYLSQVKEHRGVFVLDFHSNYFFDEVAPKVNYVYRAIIAHLRSDPELWITTPRSVIRCLSALA